MRHNTATLPSHVPRNIRSATASNGEGICRLMSTDKSSSLAPIAPKASGLSVVNDDASWGSDILKIVVTLAIITASAQLPDAICLRPYASIAILLHPRPHIRKRQGPYGIKGASPRLCHRLEIDAVRHSHDHLALHNIELWRSQHISTIVHSEQLTSPSVISPSSSSAFKS